MKFKIYLRSVNTDNNFNTLFCDIFATIECSLIDDAISQASPKIGSALKKRGIDFFVPLREITAVQKGNIAEVIYYHDNILYQSILNGYSLTNCDKERLLPLYNHYKLTVRLTKNNYF